MSTPGRQAERYAYEGLIGHLAEAGAGERLFQLVETRGFLARQADFLGGFRQTSSDVETFLLPAAIESESWSRFLHYAALGLNLRGLAEDLADPEILRALAGSGGFRLALDAAGRLAGRWDQAEALSVIAEGLAENPERKEVLDRLCDLLDDLASSPPGEERERAGKALLVIAAQAGPALQERWPGWIRHFAPGRATEIRLAVVQRWLAEPSDALSPGLWQALEALGSPAQILNVAPAGLAALRPGNPGRVIDQLTALLPGAVRRQQAGAAFLGHLATHDPERALAAWKLWRMRERPDWTPEILRAASGLLGLLSPEEIEEIAGTLRDPATLAALRVVVLEKRPSEDTSAAALQAVAAMPDQEDKLHWYLRALTAFSPRPSSELRRQVRIAGSYLHAIGYTAAVEELTRYLDLAAELLPQEARTRLECIIWSPGFSGEKLLEIARATQRADIARLLLERAERYAAAVSLSEQEGFTTRKNLLIAATCRYADLEKSLAVLPGVMERLLPEEEDELRRELALRLGAREAKAVWEPIGDTRLRLLTRLRLASEEERAEEVRPSRLYASLAQVAALDEECRGLAALLERPDDPHGLLERHVLPLQTLRTRALLRLARHTIDFEKKSFHRDPDLLLPAELVRWLLTPDSAEELRELTPEITEIAATGGKHPLQEVQEAARRLADLPEVWNGDGEEGLGELEELLARLSRGLLSDKQAAAALSTIARLPADLRPEAARKRLCAHWHRILPWVAAAASRLPERKQKRVRAAMKKGFRGLEEDAPNKAVFRLCFAEPAERERLAATIKAEKGSDVEKLRALVHLEAVANPERAEELLKLLPEPAGNALALQWIRHRWLPPEAARRLASFTKEADILLGPETPGDPAWIARAASWLAQQGTEPSRPSAEPVLDSLRCAPEVACRVLAAEMTTALQGGRRAHGEGFLRTWLHTRLPVRWGHPHPEGARLTTEAREALERALTLEPEAPEHE